MSPEITSITNSDFFCWYRNKYFVIALRSSCMQVGRHSFYHRYRYQFSCKKTLFYKVFKTRSPLTYACSEQREYCASLSALKSRLFSMLIHFKNESLNKTYKNHWWISECQQPWDSNDVATLTVSSSYNTFFR